MRVSRLQLVTRSSTTAPLTSVSHACTRTPRPRRAPNSEAHTHRSLLPQQTPPARHTRTTPHPPAVTRASPTRTTRGGRARKEEWGHGR